jgi:hypothetical protein
MSPKKDTVIRGALALVILISSIAMIPLINLPVRQISWDLFAGAYAPDLSANETSGAPGSIFAFTGTNYPPNSLATVYVNGVSLGTVPIDGSGVGTFLLDTSWASTGPYNVTLEVDINASATQSIDLIGGGNLVTPPSGFPGPTFTLIQPIFLPYLTKN